MFGNRRAATRTLEVAAAAPDAGQEALRFLAIQGLPPTPENYALAWQAKVERHGFVAKAVDAILLDGRAVLPADVARIMATPVRPAAASVGEHDPQKSALRHQTLKLADLAAVAAASSSTFGQDLSDGLQGAACGAKSIQQLVEAMIGRTRVVEEELRSASRQIETLRQEVEAVRDDAQRDALTGLLNRRGAMQQFSSKRRKDVATFAICDVDHFKSVNDRFGHGVGDRVLRAVATSLAESCEGYQVARWGGEEFVVLLDGIDVEQASVLLEAARSNLATRTFRLRETDEPLGQVTMSIGAASLQGRILDEVIELADARLYAAKRAGRNRVVIDDIMEAA